MLWHCVRDERAGQKRRKRKDAHANAIERKQVRTSRHCALSIPPVPCCLCFFLVPVCSSFSPFVCFVFFTYHVCVCFTSANTGALPPGPRRSARGFAAPYFHSFGSASVPAPAPPKRGGRTTTRVNPSPPPQGSEKPSLPFHTCTHTFHFSHSAPLLCSRSRARTVTCILRAPPSPSINQLVATRSIQTTWSCEAAWRGGTQAENDSTEKYERPIASK